MKNIETGYLESETSQIAKLVSSETSLEDRLEAVREIFPAERKEQIRLSADCDKHNRPVSYFRSMSYEELGNLLYRKEIAPSDRPDIEERFQKNIQSIQNVIKETIDRLPDDIQKKISSEVQFLFDNFTLENFTSFVQTKLPKGDFIGLHISKAEIWGNVMGLMSISVGAPALPPLDPPNGMPVVEMVIPAEDIVVYPLSDRYSFLEMSKEAGVKKMQADWIVDVYQGEEDFVERFVNNPDYPLKNFYGRIETDEGTKNNYSAYLALQDWKIAESISDFIPKSKLSEIDEKTANLDKPLIKSN
ncbi:MAG: hypothetical protein U9P70_03490 [Patescibacteria group bacterium]|nr:hypothetical protein [Patescibacteria group bacterium]